MDKSLSDFQESKRYCKGPVTKQKTKAKVKKVTKHIKGQKDIRTVLKKNKDDLITYTKAFDSVCKKSGLDVDSEQLQLAIALSKSLQTDNSVASTSQSLSTQGRLTRIKTTLKEYGFKVPDSKICANKGKKRKKVYKLITTTNEERSQKVTGKYSQVLFECLDSSKISCFYEESDALAFNIATNVTYKCMKNNEIFYVDNLIEKSTTSGCLLRDWAEIPGRPVSPVLVRFDQSLIDFTKMACSQKDLDVILSGTIKSAQNVIVTKFLQNSVEYADAVAAKVLIHNKDIIVNHENNINNTIKIVKDINFAKKLVEKSSEEVIDLESNTALPDTEQDRCCSPDLFDDEESCIVEISKPILLTPEQKTRIFDDEINYMDMTECVDLHENIDKIKFPSQNETKRKSDDFMEMTDCAVSASQGLQDDTRQISLSQCPENKSNSIATKHNNNLRDQNKDNIEKRAVTLKNMDQKEIKIDCLDTIQAIKDNIDLTQSSNEEENRITPTKAKGGDDKCESIDLTQSSDFHDNIDDLPKINLGNSEDHNATLDNTIILKEEDYAVINSKPKILNTIKDCQIFDLTQVANDSTKESPQERRSQYSKCFYDDFIHDHSDSKENACNNEFNSDRCSSHNTSNKINDIDLTQSSDDSPRSSPDKTHISENIPKSSSLGKRHDDISIDYDEIIEQINDDKSNDETISLNTEPYGFNLKYDSSKSQISDDIHQVNSKDLSNSSQNDEVFDLTDKELDYSVAKSRYEIPNDNYNFDLGSISVMDGVTELSFKKSLDSRYSNLVASATPENRITDFNESSANKPNKSSPCKFQGIQQTNHASVSIVTPNNSEYIIKTNEITPMLHYESMTTPQRNKELDKYGLRPFKRKRAIQILTHLYNQTHPMIESVLDDEQPSKKLRQDNDSSYSSPKKLLNTSKEAPLDANVKSPTNFEKNNKNTKSPLKDAIFKKSKSPRKVSSNSKENAPRKKGTNNEIIVCAYEVTSEIPVIKSVDCNPDDWVFQKKEKAKIHSCRVPLHIAFHNYVSSRRDLREAILKYEPVNIDVIHKDLVSYGHRYDPKDLLKFLDKKCITVKTADNNARNKR